MECPCSQILQSNQIYNPSTGWRNNWKWSGRCCPPRTTSRFRLASLNTPGSSRPHRRQSSRSPCTSPQSCNPFLCWSLTREKTIHRLDTSSWAQTVGHVSVTITHTGQTSSVYIITCFAFSKSLVKVNLMMCLLSVPRSLTAWLQLWSPLMHVTYGMTSALCTTDACHIYGMASALCTTDACHIQFTLPFKRQFRVFHENSHFYLSNELQNE